MILGTQRQKVCKWLEHVFGDEHVPEFELNSTTIQYLHQLMLVNTTKEEKIRLVLDDLQQKVTEYNAEAKRLSAILLRLGLSPNNMTQSGTGIVRTLAKLAALLDIKDASQTCYLLALQHLDDQLEQVSQQVMSEQQHLRQLATKTHGVILKCNTLNMALDTAKAKDVENRPLCEQRKTDVAFLINKIKQYGKEVSKLEVQLSEVKADDESIFHETLVKKSEKLKSLQEKLGPMRKELESYSSLPPDIPAVKIKIEELKTELADLEKQVTESIDISLL